MDGGHASLFLLSAHPLVLCGVAGAVPPPTNAGLPEENIHAGDANPIRML